MNRFYESFLGREVDTRKGTTVNRRKKKNFAFRDGFEFGARSRSGGALERPRGVRSRLDPGEAMGESRKPAVPIEPSVSIRDQGRETMQLGGPEL
jgi:hypothetical protein